MLISRIFVAFVLLVSRGTFAERGSLSYFCSLLAQTPVLVMKPAVFFHLKTFFGASRDVDARV